MTNTEAAEQARQIVMMARKPFVPADLAAALRPVSPKVAAMIEAVAVLECHDLRNGTYLPRAA